MEASVTTTPANQPPTSTACCKPTHNFHHPASVGQRWLDDKTDRTLFTVHVGKPPALKSTTEVVHSGFAVVKKFVLFWFFQTSLSIFVKFLRHFKINNFNEKKNPLCVGLPEGSARGVAPRTGNPLMKTNFGPAGKQIAGKLNWMRRQGGWLVLWVVGFGARPQGDWFWLTFWLAPPLMGYGCWWFGWAIAEIQAENQSNLFVLEIFLWGWEVKLVLVHWSKERGLWKKMFWGKFYQDKQPGNDFCGFSDWSGWQFDLLI